MSDARAWPSENFAFQQLGLNVWECIKTENQLIKELNGHVPEAIFRNPMTNKITSVEVKRIVGNSLPKSGEGHKLIRRRKHIIWPWINTIIGALEKANEKVVHTYRVEEHYVCVVVPDTLNKKSFERIHNHISNTIKEYFNSQVVKCIKPNKVKLHILKGPTHLFDRF